MEKLKEKLTEAGLTGNESKVYLELLKHEELAANELSKKISIDRTLTYTLLNHLIEKGLVGYIIKQNKKFFKSEKPENLLNKIKEKEYYIKDLISELNKIQLTPKTDYEVKVLEGKEGLRTLMNLILKSSDVLSFGGTGRAYDLLYDVQAKLKSNKKRISGKIIFSKKFKTHEIRQNLKIESKFLEINSEATTTIFGDYLSIHLANKKPLIILIKNKEVSDSYRNHFKLLWKQAKS